MDADVLWFLSPFLSLFPPLFTQVFLLRRTASFVSSLDILWPRLAHPAVKCVFVSLMSAAIVMIFVTGTISGWMVYSMRDLYMLGVDSQPPM